MFIGIFDIIDIFGINFKYELWNLNYFQYQFKTVDACYAIKINGICFMLEYKYKLPVW